MNIGFVNGGIGISETFIYNLIKGISARHTDTILFCAQEPYYKEGINYTIVPFNYNPQGWYAEVLHNLGQRGKNIKWRKQQKRASKQLGDKIKKCDIVFIDYGTTAVQLLPLLIQQKKKFIVHFHGFDITSALTDSYYKQQLSLLLKHAEYLVVASHYVRKLMILAGADASKVKMIRYGLKPISLQTELWDLRKKQPEKRIVFIGRLTPKKHPIALIRAFELVHEENPNTHLDIIGDGSLLKDCKSLVEKLNLGHAATFYGSLPNHKAIGYLETAWLYAQHSVTAPSGDQEGFAISLAEAALYRLPVVSTLHNGIPENVIDGETGFLVKEFDFEEMAEKMLMLLNNAELAELMGRKGRAHILQLCDPEKRIEQIYSLFECTVNE